MRVSPQWHSTSADAANCGTIVLFGLGTSQRASQSGSLFNLDGGRKDFPVGAFWTNSDALGAILQDEAAANATAFEGDA